MSTFPAWEHIARVSSPGKSFTVENGEQTPSYIQDCLLWIARETAKSGQVLMSEAILRRARYVSSQDPTLTAVVEAVEKETSPILMQHRLPLAPRALDRVAIRVRFDHTLMRWRPLPPEFQGAGDKAVAIVVSVPAVWQADRFALVPTALTSLFSSLNTMLCAREPGDANYISPTKLTAVELLDARALLETEWQQDVAAPVGISYVTYAVDSSSLIPIPPPDFIRLTYAGLAAQSPQLAQPIAQALTTRFGVADAELRDLLASPRDSVAAILQRTFG